MIRPTGQAAGRPFSIHRSKPLMAAVVLLAVLGLSACAQQSRTAPETKAAAKLQAAPAARSVPPAPTKVYPPPSHLTGLEREQIIGLLGTPGFKRKDDPAMIWQYKNKACALDLFLYRADDGELYTVRHFEARSRGAGPVSARDCFTSLLKAHEQKQAG